MTALSGTASAQSSVTIFGLLDTGIGHYRSGSEKVWKLGNPGTAPSRLGFRGSEDLGNGLSTEFWLEGAIAVDTGGMGAGNKFWNRRSTVGLKSVTFGELRMGRDNMAVYLTDWTYDAFYDTGVGGIGGASGTPSVPGNTVPATTARIDNAVTYVLPAGLGGVFGQMQASFAEGDDTNKFRGGSLGYASGPWKVEGAYGETSTVPAKFKYGVLAGLYDFGVVRLMGRYSRKELGGSKFDNYSVGLQVPVGAGMIRASVVFNRGKDLEDGNDSTLYAIGYLYNLSKRTALFVQTAYVNNKGDAARALWGAPTGVAGESSSGYEFGIRHLF
ncbi:porin [Pigmentiphaga soli]|uniref:Porin n=1 Tax=Pigmentiphaga soli TaxID=1007095 RepID=A0ABP8GV94_9BURK